MEHKYSSTCHERTPSGPGKSVRTLQVAARHRDGQAGGGRQISYTLQYYIILSPPEIFLMNTRIVIITRRQHGHLIDLSVASLGVRQRFLVEITTENVAFV